MFTVLIVDDEEGFVQITQLVLKRAGFKTLTAHDGQSALEMVYAYHPDVLILDDMMPGITGGEVCQQIKDDPNVSDIRVIMHSAGAKVRNPAYIAQIGANGVLFKPSLGHEMVDAINRTLDDRR